MKQIKHYCANVPHLEWSGNLWFTVDIKDNETIVTCKDMLLMDIGKPGYTEFENGTDIAEYVMKNPSVMNYRMGLIHSHE